MPLRRIAATPLLLLLVAGCGGGGSASERPKASTEKSAKPAKASAAQTASVAIKGFDYAPKTVTVAKGARVTWRNGDKSNHTVTADSGSFDLGNLSAGAKGSKRFPKAGTFAYYCTYHPNMHGRVVVQEGAAP